MRIFKVAKKFEKQLKSLASPPAVKPEELPKSLKDVVNKLVPKEPQVPDYFGETFQDQPKEAPEGSAQTQNPGADPDKLNEVVKKLVPTEPQVPDYFGDSWEK